MLMDWGRVAAYYIIFARPEKVRALVFASVGTIEGIPRIPGV